MICAGIDAGSRSIKIALVDAHTRDVLGSGLLDQGVEQDALASKLFHQVLDGAGLKGSGVSCVVATGYGRGAVSVADTTMTEITCHARGVRHRVPEARTVIDIGGQDSKVIRLEAKGNVRDFAMNDRCAAGTGRFLEVVAARLGLDVCRLGRTAQRSTCPSVISSTCVVFAETEITGLLASGTMPADIVAGVQRAIASRIGSMAGSRAEEPVVFTGGVALVSGMDRALEAALGRPVGICPDPQMTGALGAALLAAEHVTGPRGREGGEDGAAE
jgi:predicted CoA-substrate-specific enzyme activase